MTELPSPTADPPLEPAAILAAGRRALATEAEAIWSLAHEIDENFVAAVELLLATPGRIIACGLGKSGHIARKVAASLMATGAPAAFLHAGEAVHGDLGLLIPGDTLMIFSNSGDTREFGVILRRAQALRIPVLAVTSQACSAVAESADICLLLPAKPEICPYGTTPTTSTTMMLALGDALAIAVMRARKVSADHLQALHPGGRLGLDLVRVETFMHQGDALPLVGRDDPMTEVLAMISAKGFGVAAVCDPYRRLLGVITDGDIRRHADILIGATAGAVMTTDPRTLTGDAMARDALALLSEARITSLFVLSNPLDGEVRGLVHIHDLLRLGIG